MNQYKTFKYPYSYPYPYPGTHSGTRTHPYPGTHTRTRTRTHVVPIIGTRTRTHTQNWYPYPYPGTNARTRTRTRVPNLVPVPVPVPIFGTQLQLCHWYTQIKVSFYKEALSKCLLVLDPMDSDSGNHVCCYNSAAAQRIRTKLGHDDHWPCPEVSYDFDCNLTFDLDIVTKNWFWL